MQEKQFFTMNFEVTTEKQWFINEQYVIILCKKYFGLAVMTALNMQHCLGF